ncbi:unnamed protein product [Ceratitis capitata]|uniref:(Mediterranean fruit fly) hypothetical protein n=1 Tax=Ceratitis capitata TaxID=7213 RepID=A0A811UML8_CERCA|nr:unnamed protein product [Ceratitis capitata]
MADTEDVQMRHSLCEKSGLSNAILQKAAPRLPKIVHAMFNVRYEGQIVISIKSLGILNEVLGSMLQNEGRPFYQTRIGELVLPREKTPIIIKSSRQLRSNASSELNVSVRVEE